MRRKLSNLHRPNYSLIITVVLLIIIGIVMLQSASSVLSYDKFGTSNRYLMNQLQSLAIGILAMIIISRIDYHKLAALAVPLLYLTLVLLVIVFVPGLGFNYGGAQRWISIGPLFLQPSEIVKITFLIYLATWLDRRGHGVKDFKYGLMPFVTLLGVIGVLIMLQPDLGTMFIIAISSIAVYFAAGASFGHLAIIGAGSAVLFWILVKIAPYRLARFTTYLHPELDPQGIGYQINQALLAIGSGGLLGLGLGQSRQKYNYLPEPTGDSIFAVIAEELGFARTIFIVLLFVIFAYQGFKIAKKAPDTFGKLLAIGITSWLAFQALINISAIAGLLPLTGIPLPFISYGGSALVVTLIGVGILINISRQTKTSNIKSWR